MREALATYVKRIRELADHVKGNEQATKQSLIGPLFTLLGYDLTDPRECIPEYKADFGKERSTKPVDWAFLQAGRPVFFVEAKDAGKRLSGYDEQLADYFAKVPEAKLGILTNGIQWRFFTDIVNPNVMDREPFLRWDVLSDEIPPFDFLTLLQKSQYNAELIRAFAQKRRQQNLLVQELNRLLEPDPEFTKLAIANIETRKPKPKVLEDWKPIVANAIREWARDRTLQSVLSGPGPVAEHAEDESADAGEDVETTQEELGAFALIQQMLGSERPVEYEDTASYFKVHLPGQSFWAICRLRFRKRVKRVDIALSHGRTSQLIPSLSPTEGGMGWSTLVIKDLEEIKCLEEALGLAWEAVHERRGKPVVET